MSDRTPAGRPVLIGLIGGESSGKTTTAAALAERTDGLVVADRTRRFVQEHHRPPRAPEQRDLLVEQAHQVTAALARTGTRRRPCVVVDPIPLMTAVYSVVYFDDASLLPLGVTDARRYDLLVWCTADIPWQAEAGMRDGPEYRAAAERVIDRIVTGPLRATQDRIVRIRGDRDTRLARVLARLGRLDLPDPGGGTDRTAGRDRLPPGAGRGTAGPRASAT